MKKIIIALILVASVASILVSCAQSRQYGPRRAKTGCPNVAR